MLAAVLLPPRAEGVPEAAAPQAARPRSFSLQAATGNAPESRNWALYQTPRRAGPYGHRATPGTLSPAGAGGAAPRLTGEVFPSIGRCRAGLGSQLRHSHPSRRRARSGPWGRGRICLASGSYVSASAGRGGKPVQPAAQLHRCLFPNCSRHSMQNTCCRSPRPGTEEHRAGAAQPSATAKGPGVR